MDIRHSTQAPVIDRSDNRPKPVKRIIPEAEQPAKQKDNAIVISGDEASFAKAEAFRTKAGYDKPAPHAEQAVREYLSFERETKRDSVRQMMGVDIYA